MRIGAYEVTGELGRGATAIVYAARGPGARPVALKLLTAARPPEQVAGRFRREADALARLRHPGIVGFVEAGEHLGRPFLVTERVDGETLQDRLDRSGALTPAATIELGVALAEALAHAHGEGILHRDLKPANVLLGVDGRPRLADFGLARDLEASLGSLTASGALVGTPGFWAPEQAQGAREAFGAATDVWGLGAVLYAALTREPPFSGESLAEVCVATVDAPVRPPSALEPAVPRDLELVVLRCLEKAPAARHASAEALARALRACQRPRRRARGARRVRLGLLVGAVSAALAGAALLMLLRPAPAAPAAAATPPRAPSPAPAPAPEPTPAPAPVVTPAGAAAALERFTTPEALDAELQRLVSAGRHDEAQALLAAVPDDWLGGAAAARRRRVGLPLGEALAARTAGRSEAALAAFGRALELLDAAPAEARDEALALRVLALLGLGRVDAACDEVAGRAAALRQEGAVEELLDVLAELCPALQAGPWSTPDPAGAADAARVLARVAAGEPAAATWVHLGRAGAERARGNLVAADACLRDALAALPPDELQLRLSCAEWLLARARPAEASPLLQQLSALRPSEGEERALLGRRARLLLRLSTAEEAIARGDPVRASALLHGLERDAGLEVGADPRPDPSFVRFLAARRELVDADPRALEVLRGAAAVQARGREALEALPAPVASATLVRLNVLAKTLGARPAAPEQAIAEADALVEVHGLVAELQAVRACTLAGRLVEARARAAALRLERPGAARDPEVVSAAILASPQGEAGLVQPAWTLADLDRPRARATAEYLAPWLDLPAAAVARWEGRHRTLLAAGHVILARARAAAGELPEAAAALARAEALDPDSRAYSGLERATLLLAGLRDPGAARAVLARTRLDPSEALRAERVLRLAAVEEALAARDVQGARRLAAALVADELATPSEDAGDHGASFLAVVQAAEVRTR